jgi:GIY-YIG catalytic domain
MSEDYIPPCFEVGSRITWTDTVSDASPDTGEFYMTHYRMSGIIQRLTPYTVVILVDTEGWDKCFEAVTPYERRMDKRALSTEVGFDLRDIIIATIGKQQNPTRIDTTPHDIYRLFYEDTTIYVGITKNIKLRYRQHCQCQGLNLNLNLYIQDLLRRGYTPGIDVIERAIGASAAQSRETYWIEYYLNQGAPLKNISKVGREIAS